MPASGPNRGVLVEFQPMSPEEMQRTMQFVLHQQAQFAADSARTETFIEQLGVKVDRVTGEVSRLAESVGNLDVKVDQVTGAVLDLTSVVERVVDSVSQLAAAQQRTDEQLKATDRQLEETDRQLKETDRQLQETDRRLRDVTGMVERHLRDDHGYRPS